MLTSPAERLAQRVKITSFEWSKDGFGTIMMASFTIKNYTDAAIRDIEIECNMVAPSGTQIGKVKHTIYDVIPANKTRTFDMVNMGFVDSQAKKTNCRVVSIAE